jgi:hypothetical protein
MAADQLDHPKRFYFFRISFCRARRKYAIAFSVVSALAVKCSPFSPAAGTSFGSHFHVRIT